MIQTKDINLEIPKHISEDKTGFELNTSLLNDKKIVGLIGFSGSGKIQWQIIVENNGYVKLSLQIH